MKKVGFSLMVLFLAMIFASLSSTVLADDDIHADN